MSVDMTVHFDPKFLCRLTTMLPMVAGAEPAFVTLTKPIAHNCFGPFAPLAEVMVQLTFEPDIKGVGALSVHLASCYSNTQYPCYLARSSPAERPRLH